MKPDRHITRNEYDALVEGRMNADELADLKRAIGDDVIQAIVNSERSIRRSLLETENTAPLPHVVDNVMLAVQKQSRTSRWIRISFVALPFIGGVLILIAAWIFVNSAGLDLGHPVRVDTTPMLVAMAVVALVLTAVAASIERPESGF